MKIDPVVEDATKISTSASVCSQEVPEFALKPVTLKVASAPEAGMRKTQA